ncbi:hypothetical protein ACLKA6_008177 [Drosophila palustris]
MQIRLAQRAAATASLPPSAAAAAPPPSAPSAVASLQAAFEFQKRNASDIDDGGRQSDSESKLKPNSSRVKLVPNRACT